MKVIITGGTGLIGSALANNLSKDGHQVIILTRTSAAQASLAPGVRVEKWDAQTSQGWVALVEGADAIVNLAGENLGAGRWTARRKEHILDSRLNAGHAVVQAIQQAEKKPAVLIQASAVGYYGASDAPELSEQTKPAEDFLASVCQDWEASSQQVEVVGVRRVIVRSGVVLTAKSQPLSRMILPFKFFVGGPIGSGKQWLSWVHLEDEVQALRFLIDNPAASGPYNIAGRPVTFKQFAKVLGKVMRRPSWIPVPAFVIRLLFGEMSAIILEGQSVSSKRLEDLGFRFKFQEVEAALTDLVTKNR